MTGDWLWSIVACGLRHHAEQARARTPCHGMLTKADSPENVDWMPVMSTPAARQGSGRASTIGEPWLPGWLDAMRVGW